jgi:hypothetical protein
MNANTVGSIPGKPESWRSVGAALVPILIVPLLTGLFALIGKALSGLFPSQQAMAAQSPAVIGWLFLVLLAAGVLVLTVGWLRNFPRWVFPYFAALTAVALLLTFSATPGLILLGHTFGSNELWGWRAWIPLGIWLGLSLALSRSLRPLKALAGSIAEDWTLPCFALYSLLPYALFITFDEVQGEEPFVVLMGLGLGLGAAGYLRQAGRGARMLWLVGSVGLVWAASAVYLGLYWNGRLEKWMTQPANGWSQARSVLLQGVLFMVLISIPALVSRLLRLLSSGWRRLF